ncbi:hypothetical protein DICVIV_10162 [Dictyocaulus viviparus]|uniref:PAS fold domain-containing protein n=1 Tax=Dictyocaulus viviparus TaxID=29172 RepID=A0A0D8XGN6_DICVI|nr:hypothetical protein DICVIV_10162 [Dictyocaulus viviparus]
MRWCCGPVGPGTPLLEAPPEVLIDAFGPMSIRPNNTALLVSEGKAEGTFLERLRGLGWQINVTPVSQAIWSVQQLRPILLLLDNQISDLPTLARNLHSYTSEDVFFVVIADRHPGRLYIRSVGIITLSEFNVPKFHRNLYNGRKFLISDDVYDFDWHNPNNLDRFYSMQQINNLRHAYPGTSISQKRRKVLSQAKIVHAVQWSSKDTSLVEFVARLANRIRVMPALFTILDEADQAVEVCDESKVVQYVNRAYESVTGCLRGEVLGQPESDMRRKSLPRPRDDSAAEHRRGSDWKCIRVPTSSQKNIRLNTFKSSCKVSKFVSGKEERTQSSEQNFLIQSIRVYEEAEY